MKKRLAPAILGLAVFTSIVFAFYMQAKAPLFTTSLPDTIRNLQFSPDGRMVYFVTENGILLDTTKDWKQKRFLPINTEAPLWLSDSTRLIAFANADPGIGISKYYPMTKMVCWNVLSGTKLYEKQMPLGHVVAMSHDGKLVAYSSAQTLTFVSTTTGLPVHILTPINTFEPQFSPNDHYFASVANQLEKPHHVRIWDTRTWQEVPEPQSQHIQAVCLCYSPDGKMLATGTSTTITLWNTATWQVIRVMPAHFKYLFRLRFSQDSARLAGGGRFEKDYPQTKGPDFFWTLWNPNTGEHVADIHHSYFWGFWPDSRVAYTDDSALSLWSEKNGDLVWSSAGRLKGMEPSSSTTLGAVSPDLKRIVIATTYPGGGKPGILQVWKAPNLR